MQHATLRDPIHTEDTSVRALTGLIPPTGRPGTDLSVP
jgi:hypothetical protein